VTVRTKECNNTWDSAMIRRLTVGAGPPFHELPSCGCPILPAFCAGGWVLVNVVGGWPTLSRISIMRLPHPSRVLCGRVGLGQCQRCAEPFAPRYPFSIQSSQRCT
jgi:hypothetical protein